MERVQTKNRPSCCQESRFRGVELRRFELLTSAVRLRGTPFRPIPTLPFCPEQRPSRGLRFRLAPLVSAHPVYTCVYTHPREACDAC